MLPEDKKKRLVTYGNPRSPRAYSESMSLLFRDHPYSEIIE